MLAEIKRRNRMIAKLNRKHASLSAQLRDIEAEIKLQGGELKGGVNVASKRRLGGKRPHNTMNLADAIVAILNAETPMSAAEVEQAVTKSGYKSTAANFRTIIFQALARDKRIKRVGRGSYLLKG